MNHSPKISSPKARRKGSSALCAFDARLVLRARFFLDRDLKNFAENYRVKPGTLQFVAPTYGRFRIGSCRPALDNNDP